MGLEGRRWHSFRNHACVIEKFQPLSYFFLSIKSFHAFKALIHVPPSVVNRCLACAANIWINPRPSLRVHQLIFVLSKVFVICPPRSYIDVRETLEGRGWVENTDTESEFFDFKYTIRVGIQLQPSPKRLGLDSCPVY